MKEGDCDQGEGAGHDTFHRDEYGKLHRDDGPAAVSNNGKDKRWYWHGLRHRDDGPAVISADGTIEWWVMGKLHNEDGPAIISANGKEEFFIRGNPLYVIDIDIS